jgi:uroporphyrinogen-III synthase
MAASLNGKVIAYVEARMRSEMGSLIERNGGVPYAAPVLQEIYLKDSPELHQLIDDICQGTVDVVVLVTGVGTQALIETAASLGRQDEFIAALDQRTIIARSPKPARVLRKHKIHIDLMPPEPFTSEDLLAAANPAELTGRRVAVQAYGASNNILTQGLSEMGAEVNEFTVYNWGLPEDTGPVIQLIDDLSANRINALAFTSQPQVGNLLQIAAENGKENSLRETLAGSTVAVASVGPICTRRLKDMAIRVDVEPDHPHMGNLVQALADYLQKEQE